MKVAALYDVHGMPWALEAVVAELEREGVDAIVFGGDVVDGPYDEETLALARSVEATWIRGNVEDAFDWGRDLPLAAELDGVVYCHATPTSNTPLTTAETPDDDLVALFGDRGTFVIGHSHHQYDRRVGNLRVINAGSVGMAYEDEVAAFWTNVVDGEPTFRKTLFDVERAIREIEKTDWKYRDWFLDENLRVPPSREDAIAHFEQQRTG